MFKRVKKIMVSLMVVSMVVLPTVSAVAQAEFQKEEASAESMAADLLVARPLSLVALVAGSAIFVVSLPFSAVGGNVEAAKQQLVEKPADYLFNRPLGEF